MTDDGGESAPRRPEPEADPEALAREYYRAIDAGDYDALAAVLHPEFVQERGDRTLEGREAFVRFMREERPVTDTTHDVDAVYKGPGGVAVRGRLLRDDGSTWFGFCDVFDVDVGTGRLTGLRTFTRSA